MTLSGVFVGNDGYQTTTEDMRNLVRTLMGSGTTLYNSDSFLVTPGTGLAVVVSADRISMEGGDTVDQGSYFVYANAAEEIAVNPPSALDRIDSLLIQVKDGEYGAITGSQGPQWVWATGTPAASPVALSDAEIETTYGEPGVWKRILDLYIDSAAVSFVSGDITQPGRTINQDKRIMNMIREATEMWPKDGSYITSTTGTIVGGGTAGQANTAGKKLQKTFVAQADRCYEIKVSVGTMDPDAAAVPNPGGQIDLRYASGSSVTTAGTLIHFGRSPRIADANDYNCSLEFTGYLNDLSAGTYTVGAFLKSLQAAMGFRIFAPWYIVIKDVGPAITEG